MINYIIVDDEYIAHDIIKEYCDMLSNMILKKNCYDAIEAIEFLGHNQVDLIFLDLNMPKLKGFDFLKTLSNPPHVIVTTAYSEFALEGFELNVVDYLLKPFGFERFLKAINKIPNISSAPNTSLESKQATVHNPSQASQKIFISSNKKQIQVDVGDILFLESAGNYCKVVTINEVIVTRDKISNLLNILPENNFVQVHKSFAVAIDHVKTVESYKVTIGEYSIPIGKVFKMNVKRILSK